MEEHAEGGGQTGATSVLPPIPYQDDLFEAEAATDMDMDIEDDSDVEIDLDKTGPTHSAHSSCPSDFSLSDDDEFSLIPSQSRSSASTSPLSLSVSSSSQSLSMHGQAGVATQKGLDELSRFMNAGGCGIHDYDVDDTSYVHIVPQNVYADSEAGRAGALWD